MSWRTAFAEYCFQVPANRLGYGTFTAAQLKTIQGIVSLSVFSVFAAAYLGEGLRWNVPVGFALMAAAAFFIFNQW